MDNLRNNRDFGNRFDMPMPGMGYRDMHLGLVQGMPERDLYYHEGYLEQGIARELSRFRDLAPMPCPIPDFFDDRNIVLNREYYPERVHERSRNLDYERERNPDYRYRERERDRWERGRDYRDNSERDDRRDYGGYREKDYDRERDCDWDGDHRDYDRRDRERERDRDRDRDRDWDRPRSSRDDRSKDEVLR